MADSNNNNTDSDTTIDSSSRRRSGATATKKRKYACCFKMEWLSMLEFKDWLQRQDENTAKCIICNKNISVKYEGILALKKHSEMKRHTEKIKTLKSNSRLTSFMKSPTNCDNHERAIIEVASIYHGIMHNHSYLSIDCGFKLNSKLYAKCGSSQNVHCGRTKAECIVENVLAATSIKNSLKELGVGENRDVPYSLAIDASNKRDIKIFPIVVQYFDIKRGLQVKVLDLYEDRKEDSISIFNKLKEFTEKNDLKLSNCVSFAADNASVNYGINKSVFKALTDINKNIIKANCNCHVIHNAGRNASKRLSFDVETFVLKVYAEFSNSTKRIQSLKLEYEKFDMEYRKVLRHGPTRWLSLSNALDRLIIIWPAIKSYFLEVGEDQCHPVVWHFISESIEEDNNPTTTVPELYLYFMDHFLNILKKSVLMLESNNFTSISIHKTMVNLKYNLENRKRDEFFGAKVNEGLKRLNSERKNKIKNEFISVYEKTLQYLEENYDFDESIFKFFYIFELNDIQNNFSYDNVQKVVELLNIRCDSDILYDEVNTIRNSDDMIKKLFLDEREGQNIEDVIQKVWCKILERDHLPHLEKIIQVIFSIPVSNAFVERIFSMIANLWTDERNRLKINTIKAEICTKVNFNYSCQDFLDFLRSPKGKDLLLQSQTTYKYKK